MKYRSLAIVGTLLTAMVCTVGTASIQQFTVALPDGWRSSSEVLLILKDVEVPRDTPAKLRVYATVDDRGERHLLGSYGLVADAPDARGTRRLERLPIAITTGLRSWKNAPDGVTKIQIVVEPVDAKGNRLAKFDWKAREVTFELR